jgi:hypothetical protein
MRNTSSSTNRFGINASVLEYIRHASDFQYEGKKLKNYKIAVKKKERKKPNPLFT